MGIPDPYVEIPAQYLGKSFYNAQIAHNFCKVVCLGSLQDCADTGTGTLDKRDDILSKDDLFKDYYIDGRNTRFYPFPLGEGF